MHGENTGQEQAQVHTEDTGETGRELRKHVWVSKSGSRQDVDGEEQCE